MRNLSLLFSLSVLLLLSCNKPSKITASAPPTDHEVLEEPLPPKAGKPATAADEDYHSLTLDTTGLSPEPNTPVQLLLEGTFHKQEVWQGAERQEWLGLFYENGKYELRPTKLKVHVVEDPTADSAGVISGREVIGIAPHVAFFIRGLQAKAGAVDSASFSKTTVAANKAIPYTFKGQDYLIKAYGDSIQEADMEYAYRNYGWKVVGRKRGKQIEQVLAEDESFDDSIYVLLWAGDLDRDGIPDLLLDLSNHYNVSRYTLFLSSMAERGKLYKKVAMFETIGC
ncbi:hypothetical protein CLV24_102106 [Pontibacter ummariensis]|uniref:Uncharacterized protein n=1 Tax=Pontibacter ummariensis TaxID=1610492 RepID=A0A239C3A6_9BACT|nr:hypothetical protein [Pontibacter ummariensis]PRY15485.1 hypothetical protein CLV24_102106 [Pontibacter ummariensis]SNS14382.1 hypothetical protein SAMN06296052_102307 [Pontibacter ummariensis]